MCRSNGKRERRPSPALVLSLLIPLLTWPVPGREALAQEANDCREVYAGALEQYQSGDFETAAGQLADCIARQELSSTEAIQVYELLALSYLASGRERDARLAVINLLGLSPGYAPEGLSEPLEGLVTQIRQQLEGEPTALPGPDLASCERQMIEAETAYLDGRFGDTIQLLESCVAAEQFGTGRMVDAYRLLALAYLNSDRLEEATRTVVNLLERAPAYEPDPVQDPPPYAALVRYVRTEHMAAEAADVQTPTGQTTLPPPQRRSWISANRTWLAIGTGVVLAGAGALLFSGGGGSEPGQPGGGNGGGGNGGGNGGGTPVPLPLPPPLP